nr:type II toxin-antitoxin system RelE/ParE family toxin [Hydrogenophaga sp. 2FB]
MLAEFGPDLGRPTVDTLKGSRHTNMKELRFSWNGQVWRVALPLTLSDKPSCWLVVTKAARISAGFTNA